MTGLSAYIRQVMAIVSISFEEKIALTTISVCVCVCNPYSPWARAQNFTCRYNLGDEGYTYFLNKYMSVEDILV